MSRWISAEINNGEWPKTFDDLIRELRNPNSPILKRLNTEINEISIEDAFFKITCLRFELNQIQLEALHTMLIKEKEKAANAEKPADIIASLMYGHDENNPIRTENIPPAVQPLQEQREVLQEQLDRIAERLNELYKARESITEQYTEARNQLIETISEKVPFIQADETKADESLIRSALQQPPSIESVVTMIEKSFLQIDNAYIHSAPNFSPTATEAPSKKNAEQKEEAYYQHGCLLDQIKLCIKLNNTSIREATGHVYAEPSIIGFKNTMSINIESFNHMASVYEENTAHRDASRDLIHYAREVAGLEHEKKNLTQKVGEIDKSIHEMSEGEEYRYSPRSAGG